MVLRAASAALQAGRPRTSVDVQLSAVSLSLCEQQLRDGTRLMEYVLSATSAASEPATVTPMAFAGRAALQLADGTTSPGGAASDGGQRVASSAHSRWRLAIRCVLREKRRQRGWRLEAGFFEARRTARLRYTELWKRAQKKPWLTENSAAEAAELRAMERDRLEVEDIAQFRALGKVPLMAEEARGLCMDAWAYACMRMRTRAYIHACTQVQLMAEEAAHEAQSETAPKPRKTWYEWATGADAGMPASLDLIGDIELSNEQRDQLAALLSGGAEAASAPQVDRRGPRRARASASLCGCQLASGP